MDADDKPDWGLRINPVLAGLDGCLMLMD